MTCIFSIFQHTVYFLAHTHMSKLNYVNSNLSATDLVSRIKSPLAQLVGSILYFSTSSLPQKTFIIHFDPVLMQSGVNPQLNLRIHSSSIICIWGIHSVSYIIQHSKYSVRCNLAAKIQLLYRKSIILIFFILHWINIIIIHFVFTGCLN